MTVGTVVGALFLQAGPLTGQPLVQVLTGGRELVALNLAEAKAGDSVVVLEGDGCARLSMTFPADAAVVAVMENKC